MSGRKGESAAGFATLGRYLQNRTVVKTKFTVVEGEVRKAWLLTAYEKTAVESPDADDSHVIQRLD